MGRFNIYNSRNNSPILAFFYRIGYYLKIIFIRLNYFFVITLCVFILLYGRNNNSFNNYITAQVLLFSKPQIFFVKMLNTVITSISNSKLLFTSLQNEIRLLKDENIKNQQKLLHYESILYENKTLKEILNFITYNNINKYKIVQLSIVSHNELSNRIYMRYGKDYGLTDGNLVIDLQGNVIGKIINCTKESSEILLFSDMKARFISVSETSRINFISAGYGNNNLLDIKYLDDYNYNFNENELIYVKYKDNYMFPIGRVVKKNGQLKVKANVKLNLLNYAIVVIE